MIGGSRGRLQNEVNKQRSAESIESGGSAEIFLDRWQLERSGFENSLRSTRLVACRPSFQRPAAEAPQEDPHLTVLRLLLRARRFGRGGSRFVRLFTTSFSLSGFTH